MKVFGFGHESRMGKGTCSKFLAGHIRMAKRGVLVNVTGFASKMKSMCYDLYAWAGLREEEFYELPENEHLRTEILPTIGKTPVEIWIEFGTTVGRAIYTDTWIRFPFHRYRSSDYLILSDVRFENEIDAIKATGGYVFKVVNPRVAKRDSAADRRLDGYENWDGIIQNDACLKVLNNRVIQMCGGLI